MKAYYAVRQLARHVKYKLRPQKAAVAFKCTSCLFGFIEWRDLQDALSKHVM